MTPDLPAEKRAVRREMRRRLAESSPADRAEASRHLCERLLGLEIWTRASSVMLFSSLPDEPDVSGLLSAALTGGKLVALPCYEPGADGYGAKAVSNLETDLGPGRFGILEPAPHCPWVPLNRLDLVLVPGVAFSLAGWRVGRGKGYYDRLLVQVRGTACGVAFDWQVLDAVPVGPHDVRLTCILTPSRWLDVSGRRTVGE